MNRNLRIEVAVLRPDWYHQASDQRDRAHWHASKAEEHSLLGAQARVEAHRQVSETHASAAFSYDRASRCAADHHDTYAQDHAKRADELHARAQALAEHAGLETYPDDLKNTLGASHGEGPKVGGF
jgi:hypothetical protein